VRRLGALVPLLALAGCGDDGGGPDPAEVEACAHLATGPYQDLIAGPDAVTDAAIEIDDDHVAYRVELGTAGGYVFFGTDQAGDYLFALGTDVGVTFTTQAGVPVEPTASGTSSDACGDIRGKHRVALEVGTYFLELAPDAAEVTIVVEPHLQEPTE
jgi:hypothetical protein